MDQWIVGWIERWIDGSVDRRMGGSLHRRIDGSMDLLIERWVGRWIGESNRLSTRIELTVMIDRNDRTADF